MVEKYKPEEETAPKGDRGSPSNIHSTTRTALKSHDPDAYAYDPSEPHPKNHALPLNLPPFFSP